MDQNPDSFTSWNLNKDPNSKLRSIYIPCGGGHGVQWKVVGAGMGLTDIPEWKRPAKPCITHYDMFLYILNGTQYPLWYFPDNAIRIQMRIFRKQIISKSISKKESMRKWESWRKKISLQGQLWGQLSFNKMMICVSAVTDGWKLTSATCIPCHGPVKSMW